MDGRFLALFLALASSAAACRGGGVAGTDGGALTCAVDAPTSCPDGGPTFATVHPIFEGNCVPCHNGAVADGPWPLKTYEEIVSWSDDVRALLASCEMPPLDAGAIMSDEDRHTILQWLRCNYPR